MSCVSGTAPDNASFGDRQTQTKHTCDLLESPCPPCSFLCTLMLGHILCLGISQAVQQELAAEPGVTTHSSITSDSIKAGMLTDLFAKVTCCHVPLSLHSPPLPWQLGSYPSYPSPAIHSICQECSCEADGPDQCCSEGYRCDSTLSNFHP